MTMTAPQIVRRPSWDDPRKKALIIGINYPSGDDHLSRPHSDAKEMKGLLIDRYGYSDSYITLMLDEPGHAPELEPTCQNIKREMSKLVKDAGRGDHFFFFFAGHATQVTATTDIREEDDLDEEILDERGETITDNLMRQLLVDPLPAGSSLTAVFDCCHSATALDLDHYRCNDPWNPNDKEIAKYDLRATSQHHADYTRHHDSRRHMTLSFSSYALIPRVGRSSSYLEIPRRRRRANSLRPSSRLPELDDDRRRFCLGDCLEDPADKPHVVSLSACLDSESSYESKVGDSLTRALVKFLRKNPHRTYRDVVSHITEHIDKNVRGVKVWVKRHKNKENGVVYPVQVPQLGSLKRLDLDDIFLL